MTEPKTTPTCVNCIRPIPPRPARQFRIASLTDDGITNTQACSESCAIAYVNAAERAS